MSIEFHFDAPADQVLEMLCDADFLVDRCLDLGELSAECTIEDDGTETVISMRREVDRDLPAFIARLFNARQILDHVERWRESSGRVYHGSLLIRIEGQPVTIEAEMRLKSDRGGGCTYAIGHKVTANIPLIRRRLEAYILSQVESGARDELEYLAKSLR